MWQSDSLVSNLTCIVEPGGRPGERFGMATVDEGAAKPELEATCDCGTFSGGVTGLSTSLSCSKSVPVVF